jgi:hypothetical protein
MKLQAFSSSFPPQEIVVLGAGRFGCLAVQRLGERHPEARFRVVDVREERLIGLRENFGVSTHTGDAISFLSTESFDNDGIWIVPAVPVHVAFRWLLSELAKVGQVHPVPVPDVLDSQVPNPYRVGECLYTSFATFLCPDSCSEPENVCTHTKKPRQGNLYEHLSKVAVTGFEVHVIRSLQLGPGVGGYPAICLKVALQDILCRPGGHLVATGCSCHGVIDALNFLERI